MDTQEKNTSAPMDSSTAVAAPSVDAIRINKKTALLILGAAAVIALAYLGRAQVLAVTVNGSPITRFEVMSALERSSGKAYVETIITEKLISAEAKKMNIVVSDEDIASEIARIEVGLAAQGATMEMLFASQGLTMDTLTTQLMLKKKLEGLLAEKVAVTDAEVDAYIAESKIVVEKEKSVETRAAILEQLKGQKLNKEAAEYIDALRASATTVFYGAYRTEAPSVVAPQ